MFTLQDIASLFGGTIPVWFWVICAVVLIVVFIVVGGSSSSSSSSGSYEKGDIKIARNIDGSFYAYEADSGRVLFMSDDKSEVARYISEAVRR